MTPLFHLFLDVLAFVSMEWTIEHGAACALRSWQVHRARVAGRRSLLRPVELVTYRAWLR